MIVPNQLILNLVMVHLEQCISCVKENAKKEKVITKN